MEIFSSTNTSSGILCNNSSHLTTSDGQSQTLLQSSSLQQQVVTISVVFGVLYFLLLLAVLALTLYIVRLHRAVRRGELKNSVSLRSAGAMVSYENDAYQESHYVQ